MSTVIQAKTQSIPVVITPAQTEPQEIGKKPAGSSAAPTQVGFSAGDQARASRSKLIGHVASAGVTSLADAGVTADARLGKAKITALKLSPAETAKLEKIALTYFLAAEQVQRNPKDQAALHTLGNSYLNVASGVKDIVLKHHLASPPDVKQSIGLATTCSVLVHTANTHIATLTKTLAATTDGKSRARIGLDIKVDKAYRDYYAKTLNKLVS